MKHRASPKLWRCYDSLPEGIREPANSLFELLKQNPSHPSLHFKKVGRFWSVRVGIHYRALAVTTSTSA